MNENLYKLITNRQPQYSHADVSAASLDYFDGDTLATSTFVDKYALKNPQAKENPYVELTPRAMHERIASELARIDCNYQFTKEQVERKLDNDPEDNVIYTFWLERFNEYFAYMDHFKYIVVQGSPMFAIGNKFVNASLSNCTVTNSPDDSISSIIDVGKTLANLYKMRMGCGTDLSNLRPTGAKVNNAALTSTGAWSFANLYSEITRTIGQNNRRGALMLTLSICHPDADRFATMKQDLTKVTGANISLKITDAFMESVEADDLWYMRFPINLNVQETINAHPGEWVASKEERDENNNIVALGSEYYQSDTMPRNVIIRRLKAKDLWYLINDLARRTAEPGLLLWDTYFDNLPANAYEEYQSTSTNPCSEILLSPFDTCRLTSLNLKNLVVNIFDGEAHFDYDLWDKIVRLGMRVMDNIVDLEIERLQAIQDTVTDEYEKDLWQKLITSAERGRRTGLGTHALGDCLAGLKLRYDSDVAINEVDKIYCMLRNSAYDESVNLAISRGAFPCWDWEAEKDNKYIQRLPDEIKNRMAIHGRRNIALLTVAPTGSVSIVSQTSSGIEPVFMNYYMRRRKINHHDLTARVDFIDQNKDRWQEYMVFHHNVLQYLMHDSQRQEKWLEIQNTLPTKDWSEAVGALLPNYFVVANDIDYLQRVKLQGTLTQYLDHGSSSTINLPKTTTTDTIADVYFQAWKQGLKGVTVYVDESRTGVLVAANNNQGRKTSIIETDAPRRLKELPCDIHRASVEGKYWTIFIGLLDGHPYEIFGGETEYVEIPRRKDIGKIVKRKIPKNENGDTTVYDLVIGDDDDQLVVKDIANTFDNGDYAGFTRVLSSSLRHGTPVKVLVQQLRKNNKSSLTHFSKAIARVLSKYISDEENEEGGLIDANGFYCKSGSCE